MDNSGKRFASMSESAHKSSKQMKTQFRQFLFSQKTSLHFIFQRGNHVLAAYMAKFFDRLRKEETYEDLSDWVRFLSHQKEKHVFLTNL